MGSEGHEPEPRQTAENQHRNQLDKRHQSICIDIRLLGFSVKAVGKMPVDAPSALAIAILIVMTAAAIPAVALAVIGRFVSGGPVEAFALPAASLILVSLFGLAKVFRKR